MAAAAEPASQKASEAKAWHQVVLQTLKRNDIRLVPYVPDRVLTTLIKHIHADPFFTTFPTAREEEAVGIVSGAWMGGMRGAVLMQTSGFATLANVLASLAMPYQIPLIMFVSERGTLGEFNYGQSLVCRTMRPVLDSLAIALGVALAQPKRRIFALEGDGSLLMQLGSLSTIATLAPKNLTMVVMDNGVYQITGAQPTPAAAVSDLIAIAVASGLTESAWATDEEDFERLIDQSMSA